MKDLNHRTAFPIGDQDEPEVGRQAYQREARDNHHPHLYSLFNIRYILMTRRGRLKTNINKAG
jgi:hypothetical protein